MQTNKFAVDPVKFFTRVTYLRIKVGRLSVTYSAKFYLSVQKGSFSVFLFLFLDVPAPTFHIYEKISDLFAKI